ncbi:DUF3492 domain-containing protein [Streptomyces aidingensis]|uniref:D-inositol 3-phosphate glycosyltransferase n=1 Tax=Streptomyces aidingensis TaxID=910347 RepID=A0A1I1F2G1_9ACTN|nr:DUF3492 domain-containing protein [Streptomyces aidingensis]SFB91343.1 Glycosyltransferase involved in cell wall bisynthesis [Streptomyces aidingensis]
MRIALLTEGGYPYARGESVGWCDRLVHGLPHHEFEIRALSRSRRQATGPRRPLPSHVALLRTAPLWGPPPEPGARDGGRPSRRLSRRYAAAFAELTAALCAGEPGEPGGIAAGPPGPAAGQADRFAEGLYGLARPAVEHGGLSAWLLRSEQALRVLEAACRLPGAPRAVRTARLADLLAVLERLERVLRPLSLDWYGDGRDGGEPGLGSVDLCHAVGGGPAALPGLLTRHFYGTPLLLTEYGVRLREHHLAGAAHAVAPSAPGAPVRALLAAFQNRLAREAYARAELITPGNAHARRWQEHCGADRARLRTVYPGMDAGPFHAVGEAAVRAADERPAPRLRAVQPPPPTLVWVGSAHPAKDLIGLLHAFAEVRREEPGARLRIVSAPERGRPDPAYLAHCRVLAAQLFPDEAADPHAVGCNPVSFDEVGSPQAPDPALAHASGDVWVLPSAVEGFPVTLIEAMFCGRAAVCTDTGAVCEVIGGTGLVVPPRNPRALAGACVQLLRDPGRRARLGAAARSRALELFTVEQNVAAFRGIYLELMSRSPGRWGSAREPEPPRDIPFARTAEAHLPSRAPAAAPSWAAADHGRRRPMAAAAPARRSTGSRS